MKPKYRKATMLASPIHYQKGPARNGVTSPLMRHLNMGTLALVLFVALSLLSTMRGKESASRESAKTFTVRPDVTVIWTNHDNTPHVVTNDNQFQQSPVLNAERRFSNTFAAAGTYSYFCSIHPPMTGKSSVKWLSAEY
jgi:hypothetical protein